MIKEKNKTNKKRGRIVWKDRRWTIILIVCFSLIIPATALYIGFILLEHFIIRLLFILVVLSFLILLVKGILIHRITLSSYGVLMDDVTFIEGGKHIPKEKRVFISWSVVKTLKIISRFVREGYVERARPFLIIKTKNRTYKYGLVDTGGFIHTLKKINKINLLDKKSREKYEK